MGRKKQLIREDDIYEVLSADGGTFEIRYGYYEDFERDGSTPIPIYPDLEKSPVYGESSKYIVTFMQEPCVHYEPRVDNAEPYCGCCKHYPNNKQMINACQCRCNSLKPLLERRKEL